jgi:hypothetical protein
VGYVVGDSGKIFKFDASASVRRSALSHATAAGVGSVALNARGGNLLASYTLPADGVGQVTFSMYSIQGECVWKEQLSGARLTAGSNTTSFDIGSQLAAGMYVFRMSATSALSGPHALAEKVVSWLP